MKGVNLKKYIANNPSLFEALTGTAKYTKVVDRYVTEDELNEIKWLSFLGIEPSILKREPELNCAAVINKALAFDEERDLSQLQAIYSKCDAMLRHYAHSKQKASR